MVFAPHTRQRRRKAMEDQTKETGQATSPGETDRPKAKISIQDLYREEIFTDMRVGAIRQLTPVKSNGEFDKNRKILFIGQSSLATQHGPLPIQFPIEARNLQQALEKFPQTMELFVDHLVEQAKEMQRQEQSRIIVPNTNIADPKIILK
jgi:hypothetical protein